MQSSKYAMLSTIYVWICCCRCLIHANGAGIEAEVHIVHAHTVAMAEVKLIFDQKIYDKLEWDLRNHI